MSSINASASAQFRIGDVTINRLGTGVWGPPSDRNAAPQNNDLLKSVAGLGGRFFVSADSTNAELASAHKPSEPLRQLGEAHVVALI
jgi:hypothetical protein